MCLSTILLVSIATFSLYGDPIDEQPPASAPAAGAAAPGIDSLPVLRPGDSIDVVIRDGDPIVGTAALLADHAGSVIRGKSYRLEIEPGRNHVVEVRAYFFDSYLVLRTADGEVIAEDDNGLVLTHSRINVPGSMSERDLVLQICSLDSGVGSCRVSLLAAEDRQLSTQERVDLRLLERRRAVAAIEAKYGPMDGRTANALTLLGMDLHRHRDLDGALESYERAALIYEEVHGPDDARTAIALNNLAKVLETRQEYARARTLFERVLSIRERVLPPDHPKLGTSITNLASVQRRLGNHAASRAMYERALAFHEVVSGPDSYWTAWVLTGLASVTKAQADLDAARPLYERALSIHEKLDGPDHPRTASSLANLGNLYMDERDFERGRQALERALAIQTKALAPDHANIASTLNSLGVVLLELGEYELARSHLDRALSIRERTLGREHTRTATVLNNLGSLLNEVGDLAPARLLLERALAIREKKLGRDHALTTSTLNNLGLLLRHQGDYAAARPLLERALATRESTLGPDHPMTTASMSNLALVLRALGDDDTAIALHQRALETRRRVAGPSDLSTSDNLNAIAYSLRDRGESESAMRMYEQALQIRESVLGPDHPDTALVLNNLSLACARVGDLEQALRHNHRALSIWKASLGDLHPRTATCSNNRARLYLDAGETTKAIEISARSLRATFAHRDRLSWSLTEAEKLAFARTQRTSLDVYLSAALYNDASASAADRYQAVVRWKAQVLHDLMRSRGAYLATLDDAGLALVERLRRTQATLSRELLRKDIADHAEHHASLSALREQRARLERELTLSQGPRESVVTPSVAQVLDALPPSSVLLDFFCHPVYHPARRDASGNLVKAGGWSRSRLFVSILKAGDAEVLHLDLGDAATVEAATQRFLAETTMTRGVSTATPRSSGPSDANDELRRMLWETIADCVGTAQYVFVSPDGFLGTLPFEILQLPTRSYLIEKHAFLYIESAAVLVDLAGRDRTRSKKMPRLLCVGDVDFRNRGDLAWRSPSPGADVPEDQPDPRQIVALSTVSTSQAQLARGHLQRRFASRWTSLPATDEENRAIAEMHEDRFRDGSRLTLRGREATEERVKHELPLFDVVHLATHGFFQPSGLPSMWREAMSEDGGMHLEMFDEPRRVVGLMPGLLSGLVFSGANSPPDSQRDDGLLTAEEISFLDLSGVDLVVLSACETALGTVEAGEGMLGFRRSIRQAGANTIVSSLWSVPDEPTNELMQGFYERLWINGEGTLIALRGAQLQLLKKNRIENNGDGLPTTWGAFVLDGDWR